MGYGFKVMKNLGWGGEQTVHHLRDEFQLIINTLG